MRVVFISDTHSLHDRMPPIPQGDVLVHCGDFCGRSTLADVGRFSLWLKAQPFRHKIVIAGNHDEPLQDFAAVTESMLKPHCVYLRDSGVTINGVNFWGSPWQPEFLNWAFNLQRGSQLAAVWSQIPENTDVLITHGPPYGILDQCSDITDPSTLVSVGCEELRREVFTRVKPKVHAFGHIHEGSGVHIQEGITFLNASICDGKYRPINPPRVVDL